MDLCVSVPLWLLILVAVVMCVASWMAGAAHVREDSLIQIEAALDRIETLPAACRGGTGAEGSAKAQQ